jgi:VWFA-related protein
MSIAAFLAAQQPAPQAAPQAAPPAGEKPTFVTGTIQVQAPVTVLDANDNPVNNLTVLDFQLFDDGKLQKIDEDFSSHPVSLVVCVQASAQVEKLIPQFQKLGSLFDQLVIGETGEMAVLAFDHRIQTMSGFTSDPDKIHAAFAKIKAGSYTSKLNDCAMEGANMLRRRPDDHRRVMILLSESRDQGSGMKMRDVLTAQEFANITVYPVDISHLVTSLTSKVEPNRPDPIPPGGEHLPNGMVMTPTLQAQQTQLGNYTPIIKEIFTAVKAIFVDNPLEVYSKYTGGREFPFYSQRGLEQAISQIGQDLHSQYILTFRPTDLSEGGYHTIKVTVDKPGMKIWTREGYWMAAKPQ